MDKFKIFIVEDDPWYGEILEFSLSDLTLYQIHRFTSAKDCIYNLHLNPDLITLDYSLPDGNGAEVLEQIKAHNPAIPVVIISGQEEITIAIELLKLGATDYFVKNENTGSLIRNSVKRIYEHYLLQKQVNALKVELKRKYDIHENIVCYSEAMHQVVALVGKAAKSNIPVCLIGETGVGKEYLAKAIHYNSGKSDEPFVILNAKLTPASHFVAELVGCEPGVLPGIAHKISGKIREAKHGTLLLEEVDSLDLDSQAKLFKIICDAEVAPIGSEQKYPFSARIIVTSANNLVEEVSKGTFRDDLYFRLFGIAINIPPLRNRTIDILELAITFLKDYCTLNAIEPITLSASAKEKLMSYSYPGNISELKAIISLSAVMSNGIEITASDITFNTILSQKNMIKEDITMAQYTNDIVRYYFSKYKSIRKVAEKLNISRSEIEMIIERR